MSRSNLSVSLLLIALAGGACYALLWHHFAGVGGEQAAPQRGVESEQVDGEQMGRPGLTALGSEPRGGPTGRVLVQGVVLDASSGEPVAGARLCCMMELPRFDATDEVSRSASLAFRRVSAASITQSRTERLAVCPVPGIALQAFGDAPGLTDASATSSAPSRAVVLAEGTSNGSGSFRVMHVDRAEPPSQFSVSCEHPSYAIKRITVSDPAQVVCFMLERLHPVRGLLALPQGDTADLDFGFVSISDGRFVPTSVSPSGDFAAQLPQGEFVAMVRTPGRTLRWPVVPVRVPIANAIRLELLKTAALQAVVVDTEEPVPLLSLVARHKSGSPAMSGSWHTRDGVLGLLPDFSDGTRSNSPVDISVWAPGYNAAAIEGIVLGSDRVTRIVLSPGGAEVRGTVVGRLGPIENVDLRLLDRVQKPGTGVSLLRAGTVASGRSGPGGAFALSAPEGRYVLAAQVAGYVAVVDVLVPSGAVQIEMSQPTEVAVEVVDATGARVSGAVIAICYASPVYCIEQATDPSGTARFRAAPAGRVEIRALGRQVERAEPGQQLPLRPGEDCRVKLILSPLVGTIPVSRILIAGVSDYSGWSIREMYRGNGEWAPVASDGSVAPVSDVGIELIGPGGVGYMFVRTPGFQGSGVLTAPAATTTVQGRVEWAGEEPPNPEVQVLARDPRAEHHAWVLARADREGNFQLALPWRGPTDLTFKLGGEKLRGVEFRFDASEADLGTVLVPLPRVGPGGHYAGVDKQELVGQVQGGPRGVAGAVVSIQTSFSTSYGILKLGATALADQDGRYRVRVPMGEAFGATVYLAPGTRDQRTVTYHWTAWEATKDFPVD